MRLAYVGFTIAFALAACSDPAGQQTAEAARLLQTDRAFAASSLDQGTAAAFYANTVDDAMELPANAAPVHGRNRIRDRLGFLGAQVLDWTPQRAEVSRSLDLGWTWGEWRLLESAASRRVLGRGKYLNVWKRGADGVWKLAVDIGNQADPDLPQGAPSS